MSQSWVLKEAVFCMDTGRLKIAKAENRSDLDRALQEYDLVVIMHVCYVGNEILFDML